LAKCEGHKHLIIRTPKEHKSPSHRKPNLIESIIPTENHVQGHIQVF